MEAESPIFPFNLRQKKKIEEEKHIFSLKPVENNPNENEEDEFEENNEGIEINIIEAKK